MNVLVAVLVLAGAAALGVPPAAAAVYRCVDRDKKVTYQAEPCKSASGTRIEMPPAPSAAAAAGRARRPLQTMRRASRPRFAATHRPTIDQTATSQPWPNVDTAQD